MPGPNSNELSDELAFGTTADVLSSIPPLPEGELQFYDRYGKVIEHIRTLVALPSGDEVYTEKPAIIWEEEMDPPYMPNQTEATIYDRTALFNAKIRNNLEGDK